MNTYSLKNLISVTIVLKICVALIIILGFNLLPYKLIEPAKPEQVDIKNTFKVKVEHALKIYDAVLYIDLAEHGIQSKKARWAFYPLFPLLIKMMRPIFFNNTLLCGLVTANALSLLAIGFFYLFVKGLFDEKTAFSSSVLLLAFPTAFYLSMVYTEALFLALVFAFFYFLYRGVLSAALIAAFLLPISRPQGILVIVPAIVFLLTRRAEFKKWLIPLAFLAGFAWYLLYMKLITGHYFAGFIGQEGYVGHYSVSNIFDTKRWFIRNFVEIKYSFHSYQTSVLDRLFFIIFLSLLYPAYKYLDKTLFSYMLITALIPALSDSFVSYMRYLLIAFPPVFIMLAKELKERSYYAAMPMFAMQAVFLIAFTIFHRWVA